MFDFLTGIYCTLFGWIITPETCSERESTASLYRRSDEPGILGQYFGGAKTKKHRKHKRRSNKTYKHK